MISPAGSHWRGTWRIPFVCHLILFVLVVLGRDGFALFVVDVCDSE